MYPAFLVKRYGIEKMRKLISPNLETEYKSRVKPLQDKVSAFIENHKTFSLGTCAKHCSASKSEILPILKARKDLKITPDGCCTKIGRRKRIDTVS